jgi:hypothetical protein
MTVTVQATNTIARSLQELKDCKQQLDIVDKLSDNAYGCVRIKLKYVAAIYAIVSYPSHSNDITNRKKEAVKDVWKGWGWTLPAAQREKVLDSLLALC